MIEVGSAKNMKLNNKKLFLWKHSVQTTRTYLNVRILLLSNLK